jgi:hypothetical protein
MVTLAGPAGAVQLKLNTALPLTNVFGAVCVISPVWSFVLGSVEARVPPFTETSSPPTTPAPPLIVSV